VTINILPIFNECLNNYGAAYVFCSCRS